MEELIDQDQSCWNDQLVTQIFEPRQAKEIQDIPLNNLQLEGYGIWTGEQNGEFTIKSAYQLAQKMNQKQAYNEAHLTLEILMAAGRSYGRQRPTTGQELCLACM